MLLARPDAPLTERQGVPKVSIANCDAVLMLIRYLVTI
jgi:hypothetical protein